VTLLTQDNTGPAAARNAGVVRARGKFLAFIDDDCAPAPNWLKVLSARFGASPNQAVAGRTINALPDNPFATTTHIILDMVHSYYNADPHHARFAISSNMALPTEMFRSLGGFDETFRTAEDRDLCDRMLHRGYRLIYAPEALVYHTHPLAVGGYWRRYFNYGRGAFRLHRARVQRGSGSFRPELNFYLQVLSSLLEILVKAQNHHDLYRALLLVMWQVANAAGYLWENWLINMKASSLVYR
jgi:GT2 family glycosyltransferase